MRDFDRDIARQGSLSDLVSASELSWSPSRHTLLKRCPRACFIRYYLAQGGWDSYVHELAQSAYREKNLIPFSFWLTSILESSITETRERLASESVERRMQIAPGLLLNRISRKLLRDESSMENLDYERDPKAVHLAEHALGLSGFQSVSGLMEQAKISFAELFRNLKTTAIFQELFFFPPIAQIRTPRFLQTALDGVPVWIVPPLLFRSGDTVYAGSFLAKAVPTETDLLRNAALLLYLRENFPTLTPKFVSVLFMPGHFEIVHDLLPPAPVALIRESIAEMRAKIRPDGMVSLEDFPCSPAPEKCLSCVFQSTCKRLSKYFSEEK